MNKNLILFIANVIAKFQPFIELRIDDSLLDNIEENSRMNVELPELWFDQKVDHKDIFSKEFKQRYYMNSAAYIPGGPCFLFIGGEGSLSSRWAQLSILNKAAEIHGGAVYALEHRYYGKSWPTKDLSTKNLVYLSSRNALQDMATFMKEVPLPRSHNGTRPFWIVAGGSYPGNLAAWVRASFPGLVKGAIASSAPVQAKENFYEYDLQVQNSLNQNGGSECAQYYRDVISLIDEIMLSSDKSLREELKSSFSCSGIDDHVFVDALTYVSGIVQYNNDNNIKNVKSYCSTLKLNGTRHEKLLDFIRDFKIELDNKTCSEYTDISQYKATHWNASSAMRQWSYQCCTEFGYWQVAPERIASARSRLINVDYSRKTYCRDLFGPDGPQAPNTDHTNFITFGNNLLFPKILFTNGELDPWTPLSITKSDTVFMPTFILKGASHARDLGYPSSKDPAPVKEAKELILSKISEWLK